LLGALRDTLFERLIIDQLARAAPHTFGLLMGLSERFAATADRIVALIHRGTKLVSNAVQPVWSCPRCLRRCARWK
jgi:hypothetical protein